MSTSPPRQMTISVMAHGEDKPTMIHANLFGKIRLLTGVRCGRLSCLSQDEAESIERIAMDTCNVNPGRDAFPEISEHLKTELGPFFLEGDKFRRTFGENSRENRRTSYPMGSHDFFNIQQPIYDHEWTFTAATGGWVPMQPHLSCLHASEAVMQDIQTRSATPSIRPVFPLTLINIPHGQVTSLSELSRHLIKKWNLDYINIIDMSCRFMPCRNEAALMEKSTKSISRTHPFQIGETIILKEDGNPYKIINITDDGIEVQVSETTTGLVGRLEEIKLDGGSARKSRRMTRRTIKKTRKPRTRKTRTKLNKFTNA